MATNPVLWAEGDIPTKAKLDTYNTALQEVEAATGGVAVRYAAPFITTGNTAQLLRTRRYLHFRSNGVLQHPTGAQDDITLSEDTATGRGTLDLNTTWLAPGQYCKLSGINAAWHDDEP